MLADLEQIHVAGLRARDLVAQILTFSRRSVVMLEPLDLAIPVGEAMKLVQASTPTTIAITSRLEPGIVRADPTQIQQVVLNLCTNAVHAMRNQTGKLEVSTCRTTVGAALAAEASELEEGREYMQLTIADTGHGMDRTTLSRISTLSSPPNARARERGWALQSFRESCQATMVSCASAARPERARPSTSTSP